MDSKESSQEGEKEKLGEEMETESGPKEAHIDEIKEQIDNNAATRDEGKQEQVSDSVMNNEADKENSEGKVDVEVLKAEEVFTTQEINIEQENVDMKEKGGTNRLEPLESQHETPQLSKEVPETSEPREKVSETPEKAKELVTEEDHLSESMKRSEHTPESLESDSQIPEEIKSGQDAPDTIEHREEAPSEKLLATAQPENHQVSESAEPVEVIKETTNADKLETETSQPIEQVTETTERSGPVDNAELKPETIDSSDLKSEANEPGGKGPDASDPDVPRTIHSGELIPATIDTGESTLEKIDAGDEVPKTIDPCESITEPGQQVQERVESEERKTDIIAQAGVETGEEMISSETQQMEVKSLEQEQNGAERETSDAVDSKTESTELTAGEQEDQLKRSTIAKQTNQGIAETCQEIQQSTSEDKTDIEIETSKLSEKSEQQMTTQQNERAEQMQMEKRHKEIDQENKSADQVEKEMQQKEQSIEMQNMDVGDKVMNISQEENLEKVLAEEINLDQAVEPSESRSEINNLAMEESEAKKMESQCLDKDNNRDEPEVKNKQALELTDVLEYAQHTDSLHMMKTRENVKEISQAETSDGSLDHAGKKETGDFGEKLEEFQPQSQSWVEFPEHGEEGVSEIFEQEKESTECPEIKIQDRMETDTQTKDKICVASDIEKIDTGDKVQLDEIQLGACDGKHVDSGEEKAEGESAEQDEKHTTKEGKPSSIDCRTTHWRIGVKGCTRDASPFLFKFLSVSCSFLAKFLPNNRLAHPPLGNPRSTATSSRHTYDKCIVISVVQFTLSHGTAL